jgi:hypothetical protein
MGTGGDFYYFDNAVSSSGMRAVIHIGGAGQVRAWVVGSHLNFGFILAGPRLGLSTLPADNDASLSPISLVIGPIRVISSKPVDLSRRI